MVGLLLPQADWTADMCADLGVAQDSADLPVLARRRNRDGVGIHPDDDGGGLRLLYLKLRALEILQVRRLGVDQLADLDIFWLDPLEGLRALLFCRPGTKIGEPDDHG